MAIFLSLGPKSEDHREGRTQLYSLPTTALFRCSAKRRNTSLWSLGRLLRLFVERELSVAAAVSLFLMLLGRSKRDSRYFSWVCRAD